MSFNYHMMKKNATKIRIVRQHCVELVNMFVIRPALTAQAILQVQCIKQLPRKYDIEVLDVQ